MLIGEGIQVRAGRAMILDGISVEIHPGEVIAVLGANGAGKSTLLKVLSGEIAPTSGQVALDGVPLARIPAPRLARRRAVLTQESHLTTPYTVTEVVLLGRTPYFGAAPSKADRRIAEEACMAADVGHLASRVYTTLSGGEKQRVHLARALAQLREERAEDPRYLLLDEPTSSLDLSHQQMVLRAARGFAASGGGVLAILHDPNLAAQFADRMLLMKRGKVVALGSPRSVLTPEHIREVLGVEAMVLDHPIGGLPLVVPIMSENHPAADGPARERIAGAYPLPGRRPDPVSG